jgi:PEP-CTERM motif
MNSRRFLLLTAVVLLTSGFAPMAFGLTFNLNSVASGSTPIGTSPWLSSEILQVEPNKVSLAMSATNLAANSGQFVSDWFFNVNSPEVILVPESLNPTEQSQLSSFTFSPINGVGNGEGLISGFDLGFFFNTANNDQGANRFIAGEIFSVELVGAGLTPESFFVTNADGSFFSAAHVQGIYGGLSGWIAQTSVAQPVPEPSILLLFGSGFAVMAALRGKKFLK